MAKSKSSGFSSVGPTVAIISGASQALECWLPKSGFILMRFNVCDLLMSSNYGADCYGNVTKVVSSLLYLKESRIIGGRIPEAAVLGRSPGRTRTGGVLREFHAFGVNFTHPSCRPAAMSHDTPQAKSSLHDHWSYISRTWSPLIWTLKIRVCDSERRR